MHITLSLVDNSRRLNDSVLYPRHRLNFLVALVLLLCVLLLDGDVSRLKCVLKLLGQVSPAQLQGLYARVALTQKDLRQLLLHIYLHLRDIPEECARKEVGGLVVHDVDGEADAGALVVLTVLVVKLAEVGRVQLVLELGAEGDHEAVVRAGFDGTTVRIRSVRELERLKSGRVFEELVHEADVVPTGRVNIRIDSLCDC